MSLYTTRMPRFLSFIFRKPDKLFPCLFPNGLPYPPSFTGSGFLQNMVRILTGTLVEVGRGERTPEDMERILESRDRQQAGFLMPAKGLTLMEVKYK